MSASTQAIHHGAVYLLARLLPSVLSLASIVLLTRYLSGPEYGRYALVLAAVGFINIGCFSWIGQAFYRYYAAHRGEGEGRLLATAFAGFAASFVIAAIVGITAASLGGGDFEGLTLVAGLLLLVGQAMTDLLGLRRNVEGRPYSYSMIQVGRGVGMIAGGVAAYLTGDLATALFTIAVCWLAISAFAGMLRWAVTARRQDISGTLLLELLRYGAPLTFAIGLMQATNTVDRVLLALLRGDHAVGEYAAAFDLVQFIIGALGSALSLVFLPALIGNYAVHAREQVSAQLTSYAGVLLAVMLPASVGLALVGPSMAQLLIGPELRGEAANVMPWIAAAMFLSVIKGYYFDISFQLAKWTKGNLIVAAATLTTTALLDLWLIPARGAVGASQASFGGFLVATILSIALGTRKALPMPLPLLDTIKVATATAAMAAVVMLVGGAGSLALNISAKVLLGVIAYAALLILLDAIGLRRRVERLWPLLVRRSR